MSKSLSMDCFTNAYIAGRTLLSWNSSICLCKALNILQSIFHSLWYVVCPTSLWGSWRFWSYFIMWKKRQWTKVEQKELTPRCSVLNSWHLGNGMRTKNLNQSLILSCYTHLFKLKKMLNWNYIQKSTKVKSVQSSDDPKVTYSCKCHQH